MTIASFNASALLSALALAFLLTACGGDPVVAADASRTTSQVDAEDAVEEDPQETGAVAEQATAVVEPTALPLPSPTPVALPTTAPQPTVVAIPTASPAPAATSVPTPVAPAGATAVPTSAPPVVSSSQEALVANGAEVFTVTCSRCHAQEAADTATAIYSPLIGVGRKYSASSMFAELKDGHRITFGFSDRLTDEDIAAVVAYVKAAFP